MVLRDGRSPLIRSSNQRAENSYSRTSACRCVLYHYLVAKDEKSPQGDFFVKIRKVISAQMNNFHQKIKDRDPKSVYYLLTFLTDFAMSLIFVTYILFLLDKGLDLFQVNLVNFAFMFSSFIFEIPTGAYADYFGRKKSIIISSALMICMFTIYFFSSSFIFFIIAELFAALATTFASGALDAWIIDKLEENKYTGKVDFVFSQANIIGRFATVVGGLIGAYIANVSLELPFAFGAVISLIALMVAIIFVKNDFGAKKKAIGFGLSQMMTIAKDSISYGMKHPVILWLILSSVVSMFAFMPLNMFWTPRLNDLAGNQIWLLGWVWVGFSLMMMAGGYAINYLLKKQKSYSYILIVMAIILALPIMAISYSNTFIVVLIGFLMHEFGRGMQRPIQKAYLNKFIPSDKRATILSFDSAMGKLGGAFGLLILGWIGKNQSIQFSWLLSGIILFALIFFYAKANRNSLREAKTNLS